MNVSGRAKGWERGEGDRILAKIVQDMNIYTRAHGGFSKGLRSFDIRRSLILRVPKKGP